ncbi:uncharacterized protein BYT42DRAFT_503035 [Radiomyces spectabilis]|uniref:uncharacterized protein n=1 Tax=Radiomyces spectabilis TaxID=64574 RepID=UPI00221FCC8B|nr:uncharacterized protein BYT42DRAFT_503035 [Radiomyces spectabilis]KAI8369470.1 hypothetical protein BYT42DRAFT_503035 [Radiomyces spectabilis]
MHKNHITSVPIFSHNGTTVVSIVNLFDILLYLIPETDNLDTDNFRLQDPVENVLGLDVDRESYRIYTTYYTDKLLPTLNAFASGVHRSLVIDNQGQSGNPWLLSQTDIIRHIYQHPDSIQGLADAEAPVDSFDFLKRPLITVPETKSALAVYRLLAEKNLSGVPIVDDSGHFCGDICLEDLPSANLEHIDDLTLSCKEYSKKKSHASPPTATPDTKLQDILHILVTKDTHRVWILENTSSQMVVGVVTMSDIIHLLCKDHASSIF